MIAWEPNKSIDIEEWSIFGGGRVGRCYCPYISNLFLYFYGNVGNMLIDKSDNPISLKKRPHEITRGIFIALQDYKCGVRSSEVFPLRSQSFMTNCYIPVSK